MTDAPQTDDLPFAGPEPFLLGVGICLAVSYHLKWYGAPAFSGACLLALAGTVVGLVRWRRLSLLRRASVVVIALVGVVIWYVFVDAIV